MATLLFITAILTLVLLIAYFADNKGVREIFRNVDAKQMSKYCTRVIVVCFGFGLVFKACDSSSTPSVQEIAVSESSINATPQTTTPIESMQQAVQPPRELISQKEADRLGRKYDKGTITKEEEERLSAFMNELERKNLQRVQEVKNMSADFEKQCLSGWDGSLPALEKYVKEQMNDPDSYEHVETRYGVEDDFVNVVMKFRGKNAYNGTVTSYIKAKVGMDCQLISVGEFQ